MKLVLMILAVSVGFSASAASTKKATHQKRTIASESASACWCGSLNSPKDSSESDEANQSIDGQFQLVDGGKNPYLLYSNLTIKGRTDLKAGTEIGMVWGTEELHRAPSPSQIAALGKVLCFKASLASAAVAAKESAIKPTDAYRNINYFDVIENVFPAGSKCNGTPLEGSVN